MRKERKIRRENGMNSRKGKGAGGSEKPALRHSASPPQNFMISCVLLSNSRTVGSHIPHIFQMFFTLDPLSLSQQIKSDCSLYSKHIFILLQ